MTADGPDHPASAAPAGAPPEAQVAPQRLARPDGQTLAYYARAGKPPSFVWFGGFRSDMTGTKATALDAWAARRGQACVRFDYFGHGASSGDFEAGTISRWLDDGLAILREVATGPVVLVGSSMGGWLSLLAARELARAGAANRLAGLVLLAPAPDFTEELMWKTFPPEVRREIETTGRWLKPGEYGEGPTPITRTLIEDGRRHRVLGQPIEITCPVRILQGMRDADVPWQHAFRLVEDIASEDLTFTLVKAGDHRLSTPADIARLETVLDEVAGPAG